MSNTQLKTMQKQLNLSNQALSDSLDVSRSLIQKYRAGALPVPRSVILALLYLRYVDRVPLNLAVELVQDDTLAVLP